MNCEETREQLERWFDEDAGLSGLSARPEACLPEEGKRRRFPRGETEAHLAQCDSCRSYQNELALVRDALGHLPVEAPAPGLAGRVKTHVAVHGQIGEARMPVAAGWALAAGVVVAAGVAGWFIPISVDLRAWWSVAITEALGQLPSLPVGFEAWRDAAVAYVPEMDWDQTVSALSSQWDALSGSVTPWIGEFSGWFPPGVLWLGLGFGAMLLIGYNGFEALRLRTTPVNGSEQAS